MELKIGILQASVLGPLFYIMYIDDSTLLTSTDNLEVLHENITDLYKNYKEVLDIPTSRIKKSVAVSIQVYGFFINSQNTINLEILLNHLI